ncbi:hypothetical protein AB0N24_04575 [Arthrobacter sp. NPDC093128]|uniref:hypothetical protein n=1 Tax=Arthrobacter sp. NPDC093128 TaxID=3154979 RepID=UPI00344435F8
MGKKMRPDHHDDAYRAFQAQRWAYEAELEERTGERGAVSSRSGKSEGTGTAMSQADSNPRRTAKKSSRRRSGSGPSMKEKNRATCPVCGAKEGDSCFVLTDKVFRELSKTHTSQQRVRGARQQTAKPVPKTQVRDQGPIEKRQDIDQRQAAPVPQPRSNPGVLFGGPAKYMDEMRQKRRTDNGV